MRLSLVSVVVLILALALGQTKAAGSSGSETVQRPSVPFTPTDFFTSEYGSNPYMYESGKFYIPDHIKPLSDAVEKEVKYASVPHYNFMPLYSLHETSKQEIQQSLMDNKNIIYYFKDPETGKIKIRKLSIPVNYGVPFVKSESLYQANERELKDMIQRMGSFPTTSMASAAASQNARTDEEDLLRGKFYIPEDVKPLTELQKQRRYDSVLRFRNIPVFDLHKTAPRDLAQALVDNKIIIWYTRSWPKHIVARILFLPSPHSPIPSSKSLGFLGERSLSEIVEADIEKQAANPLIQLEDTLKESGRKPSTPVRDPFSGPAFPKIEKPSPMAMQDRVFSSDPYGSVRTEPNPPRSLSPEEKATLKWKQFDELPWEKKAGMVWDDPDQFVRSFPSSTKQPSLEWERVARYSGLIHVNRAPVFKLGEATLGQVQQAGVDYGRFWYVDPTKTDGEGGLRLHRQHISLSGQQNRNPVPQNLIDEYRTKLASVQNMRRQGVPKALIDLIHGPPFRWSGYESVPTPSWNFAARKAIPVSWTNDKLVNVQNLHRVLTQHRIARFKGPSSNPFDYLLRLTHEGEVEFQKPTEISGSKLKHVFKDVPRLLHFRKRSLPE